MTICSARISAIVFLRLTALYFPLRYKKQGMVKLAGSFESTSATNITALSSVNDFFSCILFFAVIAGLEAGILEFGVDVIEGKVNLK